MKLQSAIDLIRSHGHKAYATPEGLLALSNEWSTVCAVDDAQELMCEVAKVFPLTNGEPHGPRLICVNTFDVRLWLGY